MWNTFIKQLKRFFVASDELQGDLSERWRKHANRRTTYLLVVIGTLFVGVYLSFIRPPEQFPTGELVTIPEGSSLSQVAALLQQAHVVRSPVTLKIAVTLMGHQKNIHAGDYLFKEPEDIFTIARKISIGAFGLEPTRFFVPEGATTKQMALIFSSRLQRFNASDFLKKAQPLEGFLFPDTYFFLPNATADSVITTMRQDFDQHLQEPVEGTTTLAELIVSSGRSQDEIVNVASILEREARAMEDRRLIAGVIYNRLAKKMPLQMDVTFLYTIGKGTFDLTMSDLVSDSPYNTYKYPGLPPTPIGSPSLGSLIAAATPTKSSYLYFLADKNGVTHYCKTYSCQQANKAKYF